MRGRSRAISQGVNGVVLLAVATMVFTSAAVLGGVQKLAPSNPAKPTPAPSREDPAFRAFASNSWWNTPLPDRTPLHPHGGDILRYLRTAPESSDGCLKLAGAGDSAWGHPIYWADATDPTYDVTGVERVHLPELATLRIPHRALPAQNGDGHMTIYDIEKGYVVALTGADYDEDSDRWTAEGATVTYLESNGLHVATGHSDDPRNQGTHRGNNGATMAVPWDQVQTGVVRHVLKVAAGPEVADRYVYPMVGSDGDYEGDDAAVPSQGLRLRIKPGIQLNELDLDFEALVIARALQRYGFYIGDSGGSTALKLENTRAEGRGQLWEVEPDALCDLPFTSQYWEVLPEGYGAPE